MAERTLFVGNIPFTARAKELVDYLEAEIGDGSVQGVEIKTKGTSWMSKGYGFVEFVSEEAMKLAYILGSQRLLVFQTRVLKVDMAKKGARTSPANSCRRLENCRLSMGCQMSKDAFHELWSCPRVTSEFDHTAKKVNFFLEHQNREYKIDMEYSGMYEITPCSVAGMGFESLLLKLVYPPRVYCKTKDSSESPEVSEDEFDGLLSGLNSIIDAFVYCKYDKESPWTRTTDFTPNKIIGQSLVYCLDLPSVTRVLLDRVIEELANFTLTSYPPVFEKITLGHGESYASNQELVPILSFPHLNRLPFEITFKIQNLVQQGLLNGLDISPELCDLLDPSRTPLEYVRLILEEFRRSKVIIYNPVRLLQHKLHGYKRSSSSLKNTAIKLGDGLMFVSRLLITPSKVYCCGPEVEVSNRVTRNFGNVIDNFLRVAFVEENWDRVSSDMLSLPWKNSELIALTREYSDVSKRILRVLQDGVHLGGKHFEFLAFSASQLREQSVWMFANTESVTANSIRLWMGDFLSIRNVAKCAARMGQSFSSSTHTLNVSSYEVSHIADIERNAGQIKYCFSDGIGKISKAFAMEVAAKCGLQKHSCKVPSAFQIRYGGYKGVVAVDPSSFSKLSLRPSMCKFPSSHTGLDVLSWTHFIPCYLNRQVISLLSTLGVPDCTFESMQSDVVEQLDQMLHDPDVALEVLQSAYGGETHKTMVEMLQAGYHPQAEPYLNSLLQVFRASQLLMLQIKSRILVPKGRILMGCLDETGTLGYGEAFVQVSPTPGSPQLAKYGLGAPRDGCGVTQQESACIVQGEIVVAKNPCLHPGDVRVLQAVDVPRLHHMVDCIVFPQRGPRPHPNECSGSDLDGDLYFVSWDQRLIPPSTETPMDYNPPSAIQLDHSVTIKEIQEFFLNHMMNNSLGLISNAHTVHADFEPSKARDVKCIALAKLFMVAVDFPKTGIPAVIPNELRPKMYPDFMEKDDKPSYISSTILGKLFRSIKKAAKFELPKELFSEEDVTEAYDKHLFVDGFQQYVDEAWMHKSWYDCKLTGLMNQYGIQQEAEVLSGNILRLSRYYRRRPGDVKDRIRSAISALQKEARSWFDWSRDQDAQFVDQQEEYAKASAWYHVTYHPHYRKIYQEQIDNSAYAKLLSFPWVIYDKLLAIKIRNNEFL